LVVDGLKFTPSSPSFIDARNAIMLADRVNNGGANQCELWQAFSKHGLGFFASTTSSADKSPVESFDVSLFCSDVGIIRFKQKNYLVGQTVKIYLGDRNATAGSAQVEIKSSVTNDRETLTMNLDPTFSGLYSATIRLVPGGASPGDGALQASVRAGDKITVSYNDANNGGGSPAAVTAQADVVGEKILFNDDVESGNRGWNNGGLPAPTWAISGEISASPSHAWTDSPGALKYPNNSDTFLVSPLFDLTGAAGVTLAFAHRYDLEQDFDYGTVEYSIDDGATWARATAYTGTQTTTFVQERLDLDALAGQTKVRIRFRLTSDALVGGDGWTIDDIRLIARSPDLAYLGPPSALAPSILAVSPAFGAPTGNTPVTITGLNFTENDDAKLFFDNIPATNVRVLGGSSIAANTPPHPAGAVTVRIETRYGSATLSNAFTYYVSGTAAGAPALSNIFPTSGGAKGGTVVTVYGSNFTPQTNVTFGGVASSSQTFVNSTTLRVVTPAAPNGATGQVNVTANNPQSEQATLPGGFNYVAATPPTVTALSPNGGEKFYAGNVITLRWRSSDNKAVVKHKLALYTSAGVTTPTFVANISGEVAGEAQTLNWTIPLFPATIPNARIGVTAVDDEGVETQTFSSGDFTIDRRWQTSPSLLPGLNRLAVTSDEQYLYAIGGRTSMDNATSRATLQRLDPAATTPAWSSAGLAPLPVPLNAIEAATVQGKIYAPGGFTPGQTSGETVIDRNTRVYDIAGNAWSTQPPPPTGVGNYAMAVDPSQGVLYVTGGSDLNDGVTNVQAYDTRNNTWQALPPMKSARFAHEAAFIDGKLYVVGGIGPQGALGGGEVYDFQTGQWSPIANLNQPRFYAVSAVARTDSGRAYWLVFDGSDDLGSFSPLNSVEAYDVANNRWIVLDGSYLLPNARALLNGAVLKGFLYAVGGSTSGSNTVATAERIKLDGFTPGTLNQPPVVVVPSAQQIAVPDRELRFSVSAQDLGSGAPITITPEGAPDGSVFTPANDTNNSARGEFRWTPQASDIGRVITVNFTASDGTLNDVKSVVIRVVTATQLVPVSAADFHVGPLAADSIVAAFGSNLATRVEAAQSFPLPTSLAGTTLTVNGVPAPLLFVSPTQINFIVPATVTPGQALIIAASPTGTYALGEVEIAAAAPAIFSADSTGKGDAAALATTDGVSYQSPPFDVSVNGKPNILVLYGTGIRRAAAANPSDGNGVAESVGVTIDGRNANVLYAGAQGSFSGLDQINVEMPAALAGTGPRRVEVIVTVNNVTANHVTIQIK
jgi:uncharacterized protein (TIGR03437 family)